MAEKKKRSGGCMMIGLALLAGAGIWGAVRLNMEEQQILGSSNAERIAFINECGWQTEVSHCDLTEVRIPTQFDEVYEEYNQIQQLQGFDLRPYRSHSVKKYTYIITNYRQDGNSSEVPDICANLLVEDGVIIGADISSLEAGGMVTVLKYSEDDS